MVFHLLFVLFHACFCAVLLQIAREEYGERGVTYAAYQAEKEAAAERAKDLLAGEEEDDKASQGEMRFIAFLFLFSCSCSFSS